MKKKATLLENGDGLTVKIRGPKKIRLEDKMIIRDPSDIYSMAKILSSYTRVLILHYAILNNGINMTSLARMFGVTVSNISTHAKILEEAGLVEIMEIKGVKGIKRLIVPKVKKIVLTFPVLK